MCKVSAGVYSQKRPQTGLHQSMQPYFLLATLKFPLLKKLIVHVDHELLIADNPPHRCASSEQGVPIGYVFYDVMRDFEKSSIEAFCKTMQELDICGVEGAALPTTLSCTRQLDLLHGGHEVGLVCRNFGSLLP